MSKKIFIFSVIFSFLALPVLAQTTSTSDSDLPDPGLMPDHPLYFLDKWAEKIDLWLTFKIEKRAEKALKYADEKLAEIQALAESKKAKIQERKQKLIEKALKLQELYQERAKEELNKAEEVGKNIEQLKERATERFMRHQEVLEKVLEQVPEVAKKAIEEVIDNSKARYEEQLQKFDESKQGVIQSQYKEREEELERKQKVRGKKIK